MTRWGQGEHNLPPWLENLLFYGFLLICGFLLFALYGCASIPKQTAELNAVLGGQISESKRMTLEVIDGWADQSRGRVETLLHYHIIPQFIIKFLENPMVKKDFDKIACGDDGIMDRAFVVRDMVEAISKKVEETRSGLMNGIESERQNLVNAAMIHYAKMERMHSAISSNINSVVKSQRFDRQIRDALSKPIKEIVPLDEAKKKMHDLLESYENLGESIK